MSKRGQNMPCVWQIWWPLQGACLPTVHAGLWPWLVTIREEEEDIKRLRKCSTFITWHLTHLCSISFCLFKNVLRKLKQIMTAWNSVTFEKCRRYAYPHIHTHITWDLLSQSIIWPWCSRKRKKKKKQRMRMTFCHFNSHYWPAEREQVRDRYDTWARCQQVH